MRTNEYLTDLKKQQKLLAEYLTSIGIEASEADLLNVLIQKIYTGGIVMVDQEYNPKSENAQSGKAVAEAVGVANDYTDKAIKSLKTYANNTFAPAIKNTVSGSVLAVHDVSPVEHALGVRVRSKNLIPYPYPETTKTVNGVTFIDNGDGTITVNGTATGGMACFDLLYTSQQNNLEIGKTYTLSGCASGGSDTTYRLRITSGGISDIGNGNTFVLQSKGSIQIQIMDGVTVENLVFKPQLELGTTATEYTPYVSDFSTVSVSRYGENLWDFYNLTGITDGYTVTKNGLTATIKDGYITIAGTHTYSGYTNIIDLGFKTPYVKFPSGTYSLPTSQSASQAQIFCSTSSGNRFNTFTMNALFVMYGFYVAYGGEGTIVNDKIPLTFISGPIRPTDYKPYIQPQTVTANADGTVEGLTSISPNMTVTTDTQGVVIDMTYNADTKMYIDNKLAEISTAIVNNV